MSITDKLRDIKFTSPNGEITQLMTIFKMFRGRGKSVSKNEGKKKNVIKSLA